MAPQAHHNKTKKKYQEGGKWRQVEALANASVRKI